MDHILDSNNKLDLFENSSHFIYKPVTFENVFTKQECNNIINSDGNFYPSTIYRFNSSNEQFVDNHDRNSETKSILLTDENYWIYDRLSLIAEKANRGFFNFIIDNITQVDVLKYKTGGVFVGHTDVGSYSASSRKLTLLTFLSDQREYSGGNLVFPFNKETTIQKQGNVLVFPSYMFHEVSPVTSGERYSMVSWVEGPSFI